MGKKTRFILLVLVLVLSFGVGFLVTLNMGSDNLPVQIQIVD